MSSPNIFAGQAIYIGTEPGIPAVIVIVRDELPRSAEVVYRQNSGKIIADDVLLLDGVWQFRTSGAGGGTYAERHERYRPFVEKLKQSERDR